MWFYTDNLVCVKACTSKRSVFPQHRKRPAVGRGGDPCLAWPTASRWGTPVIQTLRCDSPRSWSPPCLEDGEHRISLVATADAVTSSQTCNKTDGETQMPKQKQRNCFFSFFLPFHPQHIWIFALFQSLCLSVKVIGSIRCKTRQTNQRTWTLLTSQHVTWEGWDGGGLTQALTQLSGIPVWLYKLLVFLKYTETQGRKARFRQ